MQNDDYREYPSLDLANGQHSEGIELDKPTKITFEDIACHQCGLPASLTQVGSTGRILNCELCGEFGIRDENGQDIYSELKLPYGDDLYEALGRFVVAFSMTECGIDFLAHAVFHKAGGRRICKALPRTFETKFAFLRKAVDGLDALQFRASDLREALIIFESLIGRRHFYIHGMYGTAPKTPKAFEKSVISGENLSFVALEADIATIKEDTSSAMAIGMHFLAVSAQLMMADR